MSKMTSRLAVKTHWRLLFLAEVEAATVRIPSPSNDSNWAAVKLGSIVLDPFEPSQAMRAVV